MTTSWFGRIDRWSVALRARPYKDPNHPHEGIVADIPRGTQVTVTGRQGAWLRVTVKLDGQMRSGYVSEELVVPASSRAPKMYYQLVPQGDVLIVVEVPANKLQGPLKVFTAEQLQEQLLQSSVATVPASALSGYLHSSLAVPAFERHAVRPFSLTSPATQLQQNQWVGTLGEVSARHQGLLAQQNLNTLRPNHPIFDLRTLWGGLNSVKTSLRNSSAGGNAFATYLHGLAEVLGSNGGKHAKARQYLFPQLSAAAGTNMLLQEGYISINADHVEPFRTALKNPASYTQQAYRTLADLLLSHVPVRINGAAYSSYQALERLEQSAGTSVSVRQRSSAALRDVRQQLANRVQSNGTTSEHFRNLLAFRQQVRLANPQMTPQQLRGWLFPELLLAAKHGGGWRGNLTGAGMTGVRGGVGGAVVSTLTEGVLLLSDPPPDPWLRLAKVGGAGTASGMTGSFTESLVNGTMGSAMARHLTTRGASSWMASSLGRVPGGTLGGGIAAPVFSMAMLALDDQQHSGTDYAAKGIRAVIPGTIAGALSAAASGALVGSAVPGLGTAVGLLVGFVGYIAVDALIGDEVETGTRHLLK